MQTSTAWYIFFFLNYFELLLTPMFFWLAKTSGSCFMMEVRQFQVLHALALHRSWTRQRWDVKAPVLQGWCLCCTLVWDEHSRLLCTLGLDNELGIEGKEPVWCLPVFTRGEWNPAQSIIAVTMSTKLQSWIWLQHFYMKTYLPKIKDSVWLIYSVTTEIKRQALM